MCKEKSRYLRTFAVIAISAMLSGCNQLAAPPPLLAQPSYGAPVKYAAGRKLEFPDFTIEFVGEKQPRSYEKYTRHEFRLMIGGEVHEVSWGRDRGDVGRVMFKINDDTYLMELVGSQEYGYLGENVMVIWKNPPAA